MAFKILKEIYVFIYIPNTLIKRYRLQIYNNIQVILLNSLTLIRKIKSKLQQQSTIRA